MNILLGNQRAYYNKNGLSYKPKNNSKILSNICNAQPTSKCKILKYKWYNKDDHILMFCFIKESHERKKGHPPSYFCKEHCKPKNIKMSTTTIKGPKKDKGTKGRNIKL